jgi:hypothetical protein
MKNKFQYIGKRLSRLFFRMFSGKTMTFALMFAVLDFPASADVLFGEPEWKSDLGLSVPMLLNSVASPIDMPRAEAYLMTAEDGKRRLEDRFNTEDLWITMTLRGRWIDFDGNILWLSRLTHRPPQGGEETKTRLKFYSSLQQIDFGKKPEEALFEIVSRISPVEITRTIRPRRAKRKNLDGLWLYETKEENAIVCAFRPRTDGKKEPADWYLACLEIPENEDLDTAFERFDSDFLDRISIPSATKVKTKAQPDIRKAFSDDKGKSFSKKTKLPSEEELLRDDYRRSVANFCDWHWIECENITVVDNLDAMIRPSFIATLTNNLPHLQKEYARRIPTPLSTNAHPVAIRIFSSQKEYLSYVGEEQKWTAALWSPLHRELVLFLTEAGGDGLLKTVWHEAFHQYLSYASSMITASPWFNEGHAELFEHSSRSPDKTATIFTAPADFVTIAKNHIHNASETLPLLMKMGYEEFYTGSQEERATKYALAWSIAYFLETGAPEIRFKPYETFRADYVKRLVDTRSMHEATSAVLTDEKMKDFIADWKAFWNKQ